MKNKLVIIITTAESLGLEANKTQIDIHQNESKLDYNRPYPWGPIDHDIIILLKDNSLTELGKIFNLVSNVQDNLLIGIAYHKQEGTYGDKEYVRTQLMEVVSSNEITLTLTPEPISFSSPKDFNKYLIEPLAKERGDEAQNLKRFEEVLHHFNKSILLDKSLAFLHKLWQDDSADIKDKWPKEISKISKTFNLITGKANAIFRDELNEINSDSLSHMDKIIQTRDFIIGQALKYSETNSDL